MMRFGTIFHLAGLAASPAHSLRRIHVQCRGSADIHPDWVPHSAKRIRPTKTATPTQRRDLGAKPPPRKVTDFPADMSDMDQLRIRRACLIAHKLPKVFLGGIKFVSA